MMEKQFNPTIGKTVLETLTSGMYDDARFIFREYIQNAADQIDVAVELGILKEKSEGKIDITIDSVSKLIIVNDNATGVSEKEVLRFLGDVANSQKDSVRQKGFRGIGRLGGLGYCDKLIFETSYFGESVKSKMTLDAKLLKKIIENRNDNSDAAAAISIITKIEKTEEEVDKHYFRVTLNNAFNTVLDTNKVTEYLSMVAPVPFAANFSFIEEIKSYLKNKNAVLDEYNVEINGETLFKRYKNTFLGRNEEESKLIGVDFVDILDDDQNLLAVCWYGYRALSNVKLSDLDYEKGIRLRTKNIAIGNEMTCNRFFGQERTNLRFIGEIHTVSDGFRPNARRDYFVENSTCLQFQEKAAEIFKLENLENRLAQAASKLHNGLDTIEKYNKVYENFVENRGAFENEATESFHLSRLTELKVKALKAKNEIDRIIRKGSLSSNVGNLVDNILADKTISLKGLSDSELEVSKYTPPVFDKLNEEQKAVVLGIFEILEEELDFYLSEQIKKRIVDKYN
ncbi:MAG: ATP-binding protein [Bacteroidetes bacterium]|nr:ATP-binding protein [Bacteroidota bacterium]HET6245375.1 ATP-binding protein [Bacteroidia bacterium]